MLLLLPLVFIVSLDGVHDGNDWNDVRAVVLVVEVSLCLHF